MERRCLPGTDLWLSVVGLGCWGLSGRDWGPVRDEDGIAAIHAALDVGIDWFDTAPLYGHGHADELLRTALGDRLKDVVVATKVGVRFDPGTDRAESDLSAGHVRQDCEESLRRLGLERIDLLQVHWPCERGTPLTETIGTLEALRDEGKIRAFGLCNYNVAGLTAALDVAPVASLQTPLSLVRREAEHDLLPLCVERDVGVLPYETLCRGLLSGKYDETPRFAASDMRSRDPRFAGGRFVANQTIARGLMKASQSVGLPPAALAIGWTLTRPGVTAAVVGAKTPAQVRDDAHAAAVADRPDLFAKLEPYLERIRRR